MHRRSSSHGLEFSPSPCSCSAGTALAAESANPYVGHWALTIPGGGAGWLGVTESDGKLAASILWGGGSVAAGQTK